MSLQVRNIYYKKYKKFIFENLSFDINQSQKLGIIFKEKKYSMCLLNLLLGKKKIYKGTIYLNKSNITTFLPKDRSIACISPSTFRIGLLPTKLRLTYSLLKSPKFLLKSSLIYINSKFCYNKLTIINENYFEEKIFNDTEKIIEKYIDDVTNIRDNWIDKYLADIEIIYDKKIKDSLQYDKSTIVFQTIKTFFLKREEFRVHEGILSFLQSLLDKIKYISELDYSCNCNFFVKKNKLKKHRCFVFDEVKLVCEKYIKILKIKIWYERYVLIKYRINIKKYYFNMINVLFNKGDSVINWRLFFYKLFNSKIKNLIKLSDKKWTEYNQKQEKLLTVLLPDEASIIKGKIIEKFHRYHILLLNNEKIEDYVEYNVDKSILKQKIEKARLKVINVYNQAYNFVKELMKDLNIKMNWFKLTKNLSSFDQIKIKLINAIITRKQLIIFYNTFDNLTRSESIELFNIINNIKVYNSEIIFLFFSKDITYIKNYVDDFLLFNETIKEENEVISKNNIIYAPKNLDLYEIVNNDYKNVFEISYNTIDNCIENSNFSFRLPKDIFLPRTGLYILAVNPRCLTFRKTEKYNTKINLSLKGAISKFIKKYELNYEIFVGTFEIINNFNLKVISSDSKLNTKKISHVFFETGAILIYDFFTRKLVKII